MNNNNNSRPRPSSAWHRRIGIFISIPALIIALSGLILNHSKRLNLHETYISNTAILSWYGMSPKTETLAFELDGIWATQFENDLYLNETLVVNDITKLKDIEKIGDFIVVASLDSLFLFHNSSKELIEKVGSETLPAGNIQAIAVRNNRLLIDTTEGSFSTPSDISNFITDNRPALEIADPTAIPAQLKEQLLDNWRGKGLSLWRIVLDIHSGNFFGAIGVFFADLAAVCIVLLVISGLYYWSRRRSP